MFEHHDSVLTFSETRTPYSVLVVCSEMSETNLILLFSERGTPNF